MKKRVHTMITAFRDGFQSVYGARVLTKDFLPAVEAAAAAGIDHFEAGGGARFQSLYFYCNEDAFEMMDAFRKAAGPNANLQTLSRGVNVVGLDSYSRDIIKLHAKLFKKHGMTMIRNFDALNDVNNLIDSGRAIHEAGLKHEVAVTMMALPPGLTGAHDPEFYEKTLKQILDADIPFDSVCFKDASGTSVPATVYETIKRARALLGPKAHLVFHTHETAGASIACYKAAIEAGADQVDCSLAPTSGGTCQPDIIALWHSLRGTEYDLGLDVNKLLEAEEVFKECMKDYFLPPEALAVEPMIPFSPMPGGALTANTQMMRDNGILNRYPEVIAAMGECVAMGGFGTSVTPVSQFYFQQAFNNVMVGPWKKIAEGYGKMVLGYFGKTPVAPDPEIVKIAQEQLGLEPTTDKVVDINDRNPKKSVDAQKKILEESKLPVNDENIFIVAMCGDKGVQFLKGEARVNVRKISEEKKEAAPAAAAPAATSYDVTVNSNVYNVRLEGSTAIVNGTAYTIDVRPSQAAPAAAPVHAAPVQAAPVAAPVQAAPVQVAPAQSAPAAAGGAAANLEAPLPGLVLRFSVKPGDRVKEGDTVLVLESMKMETPIAAPATGTVASFAVAQGDQVKAGQILAVIQA